MEIQTLVELTVKLDSLRRSELALRLLELVRDVEQSHLHMLRAHHLIEKREMVAEEKYRGGIVHRLVLAHELLEEDRRHRRDVLVRERKSGGPKPRMPG